MWFRTISIYSLLILVSTMRTGEISLYNDTHRYFCLILSSRNHNKGYVLFMSHFGRYTGAQSSGAL